MNSNQNMPWPTQKEDLALAEHIILKHIELNGGEAVGIYDVRMGKHTAQQCFLSEWVVELQEIFIDRYGRKEGMVIAYKVIFQYLHSGETIH